MKKMLFLLLPFSFSILAAESKQIPNSDEEPVLKPKEDNFLLNQTKAGITVAIDEDGDAFVFDASGNRYFLSCFKRSARKEYWGDERSRKISDNITVKKLWLDDDGRTARFSYHDGNSELVEIMSPAVRLKILEQPGYCGKFSQSGDGNVIAALSHENVISLWNGDGTVREEEFFRLDRNEVVKSIKVFSPSGNSYFSKLAVVVSRGENDHYLHFDILPVDLFKRIDTLSREEDLGRMYVKKILLNSEEAIAVELSSGSVIRHWFPSSNGKITWKEIAWREITGEHKWPIQDVNLSDDGNGIVINLARHNEPPLYVPIRR